MLWGKPITTLVQQRFSCRTYQDTAIEPETRAQMEQFLSPPDSGPFGTPVRFKLIAATEEDESALKGLTTYGFIHGVRAFIAGAVQEGEKDLEDFGYRMETAILFATALDLGTCWLGGTFNRSRFAAAMGLRDDETLPAVAAVGTISDQRVLIDRLIRRQAEGERRFPWSHLFFERHFDAPISREAAGAYAVPLEMVRLAPSASNKQPWRIVRDGTAWHFYLQRTWGYRERNWNLARVPDMQRIDMGIAMCHFALAAAESGLDGHWILDEPALARPDDLVEYSTSWLEDRAG